MASFVPALARSSQRRGAGQTLARLAAGVMSRGRSSLAKNASPETAKAPGKAHSLAPLPPGSFGAAISRPWCLALVELSQPSSTDATLDLACGEGTCAFVVADAIEEAKIWGPPPGAGPGAGQTASVLGLDNNRRALEKARETSRLFREETNNTNTMDAATKSAAYKSVEVSFAWADACDADAPWHEARKKQFARAYCAFGLNHFKDKETALSRVRETLVPGGTFVCSVWAPLSEKNHPLFYAAYLATVETIDLMEAKKAMSDKWLVDAKTETFTHFGKPFDFVEPGGDDENARALDKLERMLIKAGFDAPDAAVETAGHARFENLEHALRACVENLSFLDEMRFVDDGFFYQTFLETFEALLGRTAGDDLVFDPDTSAFTVPSTAYFAHATAPWR